MAWLEATLFFLVVPAASFVVGLLLVWTRATELRDEQRWRPGRQPPAAGLPLFGAILATHTIFGSILWFFDQPVLDAIDRGVVPDAGLITSLHLWAALLFGWTAAVISLTQAWTARVRWRSYAGPEFARAQSLVIQPEACTIFALVLVFLILGSLGDLALGDVTTTRAAVDSVVLSLQIYALSVLAVPIGMAVSHRQASLVGKGYSRALIGAEAGLLAPMVALAWAFFQTSGIPA